MLVVVTECTLAHENCGIWPLRTGSHGTSEPDSVVQSTPSTASSFTDTSQSRTLQCGGRWYSTVTPECPAAFPAPRSASSSSVVRNTSSKRCSRPGSRWRLKTHEPSKPRFLWHAARSQPPISSQASTRISLSVNGCFNTPRCPAEIRAKPDTRTPHISGSAADSCSLKSVKRDVIISLWSVPWLASAGPAVMRETFSIASFCCESSFALALLYAARAVKKPPSTSLVKASTPTTPPRTLR
mmetsp:Transcript_3517/g.8298  ORF Transcript_3517/g.8298 Transcript_3517/m.8298 type:complete len:241 (-) Transcript_3517:1705-2427(-)